MGNSSKSSLTIESMSDDVIVEIFKHLSTADLCVAARVCRRWHHLSQSRILWKRLQLENANYNTMLKILSHLPSSVTHLRLGGRHTKYLILIPLSLLQIMVQVANRCPSLKSLIIEKRMLLMANSATAKFLSEDPDIRIENELDIFIPYYWIIDQPQVYPVLESLKVLSIRRTMYDSGHFSRRADAFALPQVEVLDFTGSLCFDKRSFSITLCNLSTLQELYLALTCIDIETLEKFKDCLKGLKVLDLEGLDFEGATDRLIELLDECQLLEKLYLGYSNWLDDSFLRLFGNGTLPHLTTLCLRYTSVSYQGIGMLKGSCKSMKHVAFTGRSASAEYVRRRIRHICEPLWFDDSKYKGYCDHFRENNYYI